MTDNCFNTFLKKVKHSGAQKSLGETSEFGGATKTIQAQALYIYFLFFFISFSRYLSSSHATGFMIVFVCYHSRVLMPAGVLRAHQVRPFQIVLQLFDTPIFFSSLS